MIQLIVMMFMLKATDGSAILRNDMGISERIELRVHKKGKRKKRYWYV